MTTDLIVQPVAPVSAPVVTSDQYDLIRRTVAKDATPDELQLYLYDCQRQGVHPLDKLLHFTKRGGKYTPVTSIDLMRSRAADTGEHAGTDEPFYDGEPGSATFQASVTVYRFVQGERCRWSATARWSEYFPGDAQGHMWRKMPHLMLGKCAEALALRKAFPRQLAGVYTREEMDQADAPVPVPSKIAPPTASYAASAPHDETGSQACPTCGGVLYRLKYPPRGGGEAGWYCSKTKGCGASFRYEDIIAPTHEAEVPNEDSDSLF